MLPVIVTKFNNPDLNSIRAVRSMPDLQEIPFYYPADEELRIEIVYEAGRKILPYNFHGGATLPRLPFVLVSASPAQQLFPSEQMKQLKLEFIGKYDDNKRPENRSLFVRYVTLVQADSSSLRQNP